MTRRRPGFSPARRLPGADVPAGVKFIPRSATARRARCCCCGDRRRFRSWYVRVLKKPRLRMGVDGDLGQPEPAGSRIGRPRASWSLSRASPAPLVWLVLSVLRHLGQTSVKLAGPSQHSPTFLRAVMNTDHRWRALWNGLRCCGGSALSGGWIATSGAYPRPRYQTRLVPQSRFCTRVLFARPHCRSTAIIGQGLRPVPVLRAG